MLGSGQRGLLRGPARSVSLPALCPKGSATVSVVSTKVDSKVDPSATQSLDAAYDSSRISGGTNGESPKDAALSPEGRAAASAGGQQLEPPVDRYIDHGLRQLRLQLRLRKVLMRHLFKRGDSEDMISISDIRDALLAMMLPIPEARVRQVLAALATHCGNGAGRMHLLEVGPRIMTTTIVVGEHE